MQSKRVAIFLGAGASRAMGLPLTADLLPRIARRLHRNRLFDDLYPEHTKELRRFFRRSFPQLLKPSVGPASVVELLTSLDHYLRGGRAPWPMTRRELKRYRLLVATAICELLYAANHRIEAPARARWEKVLRSLPTSRARGFEIAIITTNYDQIVDEILVDAFGDSLDKAVDYGVDRYNPDDCLVKRPARPQLRYYKLQGSLNSVACSKCRRLYINTEAPIYLVPFQVRTSASTCDCGHYPLAHTIVAPSSVSQIPIAAVRHAWRCSENFLRTAHEWLFVGYSLPAEDVALRDMMLRAFRAHRQKPRIEVVTRDERSAEANRYRFYFAEANRRLRTFGGGLEAYLQERDTIATRLQSGANGRK